MGQLRDIVPMDKPEKRRHASRENQAHARRLHHRALQDRAVHRRNLDFRSDQAEFFPVHEHRRIIRISLSVLVVILVVALRLFPGVPRLPHLLMLFERLVDIHRETEPPRAVNHLFLPNVVNHPAHVQQFARRHTIVGVTQAMRCLDFLESEQPIFMHISDIRQLRLIVQLRRPDIPPHHLAGIALGEHPVKLLLVFVPVGKVNAKPHVFIAFQKNFMILDEIFAVRYEHCFQSMGNLFHVFLALLFIGRRLVVVNVRAAHQERHKAKHREHQRELEQQPVPLIPRHATAPSLLVDDSDLLYSIFFVPAIFLCSFRIACISFLRKYKA